MPRTQGARVRVHSYRIQRGYSSAPLNLEDYTIEAYTSLQRVSFHRDPLISFQIGTESPLSYSCVLEFSHITTPLKFPGKTGALFKDESLRSSKGFPWDAENN